ncbi:B3 domain-containing protein [Raphanus sativus]|nr:B3 domain-containing protein [Raphanus sativus]
MVTHDDDANKRVEGSKGGEKRCFDLLATLLLAYGNDETKAKLGQEAQERRDMLVIDTVTSTSAATKAFLFGKRKIDYECNKNQENTSSSTSSRSLVEYKRRRVESSSDDEPIRAVPITQIKPRFRERKGPVKQKEPVRREPGMTPEWLVELMRRHEGVEAKLVIEKVITKTDLKPDQGRFLAPFKQITEMDFLNERELSIVEKHHRGDSEKGLDVILLNGNDAEVNWDANLRIWEMRSNFNYALCTGWNQFVRENDLAVNQTRRLWSFHSRDGTLFLAFDPLITPVTTHAAASSSSMAMVVVSEDPFVLEEINRRLLPEIPRRSRTPRVWIPDPTSDSSNVYLLEGGLDLNRTPPPEDTDEMDLDLEDVQETHVSSTSQESLTETSLVLFTETTTLDLELGL